jgi:thiol-disulfide isomerase/thioredoxin
MKMKLLQVLLISFTTVWLANGQSETQSLDSKTNSKSFSFTTDKDIENSKAEIIDDTTELREFAGKQIKFMYKSAEGKRLTLLEKDDMFLKYGELRQQFSFNAKERIVDMIISVPSPDDEAALKEEQNKKEAAYANSWIGKPFPDFEWEDLSGKKYTNASFKGKTVVLNFWFVACPPCRKEMPTLNAIVKKFKSRGVVFLAPALDNREKLLAASKKIEFDYSMITQMFIPESYFKYLPGPHT